MCNFVLGQAEPPVIEMETASEYETYGTAADAYDEPMQERAPLVFSVLSLLPLAILFCFAMLGPALVSYNLAKEKGRNAFLWLLVGFIPVSNFYTMMYLVGTKEKV